MATTIIISKEYCSTTSLIASLHPWNIIVNIQWAPSSEFVSSSIPSWQILTAHVQPFRGARDLVFCLKVPLDSLLVWASSEGSGETARMRRLAWTFAARICDKYQIRLTRSKSTCLILPSHTKCGEYYVIPSEPFECLSVRPWAHWRGIMHCL